MAKSKHDPRRDRTGGESCGRRRPIRSDRPATVSLSGLSLRQRALVERHAPLVQLTLLRTFGVNRKFPPDRADIAQEGFVALAEAIRSHDPDRHGVFASYAMARIHFAMSRYRHESGPLIRVPFVVQRRRRDEARKRAAEVDAAALADAAPDDALPRIVAMASDAPRRIAQPRHHPDGPAMTVDFVTIGDLIRQRFDLALSRAVAAARTNPRLKPQDRDLIERCAAERLGVACEAQRTPLRRLAAEIGCPVVRVSRREGAVCTAVGKLLSADAVFQELLRRGRAAQEGWRERVSDEEVRELEALSTSAVPLRGAGCEGERQGSGPRRPIR